MKNIILKIPTLLFFIGLILGPVMLYVLAFTNPRALTSSTLSIVTIIDWSIIVIWIISVVQYFSFESKSNKNNLLIYFFITASAIFSILDGFFVNEYIMNLLSLVTYFITTILIIPKIKNVFYARSTWFIFVELLIIPIGILTLTPEIKRWEKSDKK